MIEAIGFAAAVVIGGILGLLGGGGSILALPVFTYLLDVPPKPAIVASLVVVAFSSLAGGINSLRHGDVDVRRGALFLAGSIPGAIVGGLLGRGLDDTLQLILFALVMLAAAIAMLRRTERAEPTDGEPVQERASVGRAVAGIIAGALIGVLTGIVGAGGGFLIVPALTVMFAVPMRKAIGTSMLVIAINSAASLIGYFDDQRTMTLVRTTMIGDMAMPLYLIVFTVLMTVGVLGTGRIRKRLSANLLRVMFASFLLLLASAMLILNLW